MKNYTVRMGRNAEGPRTHRGGFHGIKRGVRVVLVPFDAYKLNGKPNYITLTLLTDNNNNKNKNSIYLFLISTFPDKDHNKSFKLFQITI